MKTFEQKQADSKKPLLWISMVSMTMFFAAFISAIIVHKADGKWLEYKLPIWIYISTIIIIISSFTINWAKQSVKINKVEIANRALTYTFNLGLFFSSYYNFVFCLPKLMLYSFLLRSFFSSIISALRDFD